MKAVPYALGLFALAACGPAPSPTVAVPSQAGPTIAGRMDALRKASEVYAPVLPGAALHTAPAEDGFTCDSVVIEGTLLRACGKGPVAMDSLIATGEHTDPGRRFLAMAKATKAIFSVIDPQADRDQFALVQRQVAAATEAGAENVRVCSGGGCVKVSASSELWSLAATTP